MGQREGRRSARPNVVLEEVASILEDAADRLCDWAHGRHKAKVFALASELRGRADLARACTGDCKL